MCGRFSLFAPQWLIEKRFEAAFAYPHERRYNAAPGQALPVISDERPDRIQAVTWGLVPTWADDADASHVNARAETLADKPSFQDAFRGVESGETGPDETPAAGRSLVLADGYYEWNDGGQPYRVARTDGEPFAMAGLWTRWRPADAQTGLDQFGADGPGAADDGGAGSDEGGGGNNDGGAASDDGPELRSTFAIVTTAANDVVAPIHDRMPVILPAKTERRWLTADVTAAGDLLEPVPGDILQVAPISRAVNDAANDSPAVLTEVDVPG